MIVLDTNVVSEFFRPSPSPQVIRWIESLVDEVAITSITAAELLAGVERLPSGSRKNELSTAVNDVLDRYSEGSSILPFDIEAARHYAVIVTSRLEGGRPISTADAQIAAICRSRSATCATRNIKDFADTGIDLYNPWD